MPNDLRQFEASRRDEVVQREGIESFTLTMVLRSFVLLLIHTFVAQDDGMECQVYKRPGLHAFLKSCAEQFDTFVFTAGTQSYAEVSAHRLAEATQ